MLRADCVQLMCVDFFGVSIKRYCWYRRSAKLGCIRTVIATIKSELIFDFGYSTILRIHSTHPNKLPSHASTMRRQIQRYSPWMGMKRQPYDAYASLCSQLICFTYPSALLIAKQTERGSAKANTLHLHKHRMCVHSGMRSIVWRLHGAGSDIEE